MSQSAHEKSNPKHVQKPEQQKPEPPVVDASPDDPIGVTSGGTGKPGKRLDD